MVVVQAGEVVVAASPRELVLLLLLIPRLVVRDVLLVRLVPVFGVAVSHAENGVVGAGRENPTDVMIFSLQLSATGNQSINAYGSVARNKLPPRHCDKYSSTSRGASAFVFVSADSRRHCLSAEQDAEYVMCDV